MSLKVKGLDREITSLNSLGSKQRRFLKAISTEPVFKLCVDYLTLDKASWNIRCGRMNESIWKAAFTDKADQVKSLNDWLKMASSTIKLFESEEVFVDEKLSWLSSLAVSKCEMVDIPPVPFTTNETARVDKDLTDADFHVIDENIRSVLSVEGLVEISVGEMLVTANREESKGQQGASEPPTLEELIDRSVQRGNVLDVNMEAAINVNAAVKGEDRKPNAAMMINENSKERPGLSALNHPYGFNDKENRFPSRNPRSGRMTVPFRDKDTNSRYVDRRRCF